VLSSSVLAHRKKAGQAPVEVPGEPLGPLLGGGGLEGILGFLVLGEKVESFVVDICTHRSLTFCSAITTTRYLIPEMTVKAWYNSSAMILAVIGFQIAE
jgi:hypothetical protein